jgi:hypothetical protein
MSLTGEFQDPAASPPGKSPDTYWVEDCEGPGSGLHSVGQKNKTCLCWEQNPGRSGRSPSLYRLG